MTYSYLLPLLVFVIYATKTKRIDIFIIIGYCIIYFFLNILYYPILAKLDQIIYYSFYTFLESLSFSLILLFNIYNRKVRVIILISQILFGAFQIIFLLNATLKILDSVPIGIETILIYIFIFYFFFERFQNAKNEYIYHDHCFWICIGLMLYLGGSFFFYILADNMELQELRKYYNLTYIIETVKNILFSVAIIVYAKHKYKEKIPNQKLPFLDFN